MAQNWTIYILRCSDGSLYTGITTDMERRLHEHNHSSRAAKYTRVRRPLTLAYQESASSRAAASRREWEIKQLSATQKRRLISAQLDNSR